jgi:carboxymethylenebutenolidase
MGETVRITAADGHRLDAYVAPPRATPRGGVVVVQEIFGITKHIERVADRYADEGYRALAPAMFDRIERGIVVDYGDVQTGRDYMQKLEWPNTLRDVAAAIDALGDVPARAVVGFCWGGTVAHVAATELDIDAAISYYGGGVARMLDRQPKCPIIYHFGDRDAAIPMTDVAKIKSTYPDAIVHVYPGAGHGFSCEDRQSYSPNDARLAFERSIAFLRAHVG